MLCKICECGNVLKFEKMQLCPDPCPSCGRITQSYITYSEDDPMVMELSSRYSDNVPSGNYLPESVSKPEVKEKIYVLVSGRKGYELRIPNDGCIIGRTELGANELADNPAVSKKHIVVTVNKKFGLFIEDISSFGTYVNGKQVLKNDKVHISNGDEITLYNEKFIVKEI